MDRFHVASQGLFKFYCLHIRHINLFDIFNFQNALNICDCIAHSDLAGNRSRRRTKQPYKNYFFFHFFQT